MKFAVLAPGQSLTREIAESVRDVPTIAVNRAYELAPWAVALAACDKAWWRKYGAVDFAGRKFCLHKVDARDDIEVVQSPETPMGSSSGLLGLEIAKMMGATEIELYGFDNRGGHFHEPHEAPLRNPTPERFKVFDEQFAQWRRANGRIRVINCTQGSALTAFPCKPG